MTMTMIQQQKVKINLVDNKELIPASLISSLLNHQGFYRLQHYDAFILTQRYWAPLAGSRVSVPSRVGAR
jgi:hypothetical protein